MLLLAGLLLYLTGYSYAQVCLKHGPRIDCGELCLISYISAKFYGYAAHAQLNRMHYQKKVGIVIMYSVQVIELCWKVSVWQKAAAGTLEL